MLLTVILVNWMLVFSSYIWKPSPRMNSHYEDFLTHHWWDYFILINLMITLKNLCDIYVKFQKRVLRVDPDVSLPLGCVWACRQTTPTTKFKSNGRSYFQTRVGAVSSASLFYYYHTPCLIAPHSLGFSILNDDIFFLRQLCVR